MVFLVARKKTLKDLTETMGKETIDSYNTSDTRGSQRSYGLNYQKLGKELMSMIGASIPVFIALFLTEYCLNTEFWSLPVGHTLLPVFPMI